MFVTNLSQFDALTLAEKADMVKGFPEFFTPEQRAAVADAIVRYYYYIEVGIRDDAIAPLKEEWPIHVMQVTNTTGDC
eukprot:8765003-Pyramimonas_sp.AAC.1